MKPVSPKPRPALWQELVQYWVQHPEAQDTLEGIAEWWLLEHRIQQATADLKAALQGLVREGFVSEHLQPDGRVSYGLNLVRRAELMGLSCSQGTRHPRRGGAGRRVAGAGH